MQVEGSDTYKNMQRAYENQIKALEAKLSQAKKSEKQARSKLEQVPSDRIPEAISADGMPKRLPGLEAPTPIASSYTEPSGHDSAFDVLRKEYGQTKARLMAAQDWAPLASP